MIGPLSTYGSVIAVCTNPALAAFPVRASTVSTSAVAAPSADTRSSVAAVRCRGSGLAILKDKDVVTEPGDRQTRFTRPDLMVSVNARHSAGLKARTEPSGFLESRASRKVGSAETSTHSPPLLELRELLRQLTLERSIVGHPLLSLVGPFP